MSAIGAVLAFQSAPIERGLLDSMVEAGAHLGPDGSQIWQTGSGGLAHCHFWTTPEEVGEAQPLVDEEAGYSLCFDGRLDNRQDLLERLRQSGSTVCQGASDAQLVLNAFKVAGLNSFVWLVGDFALVVYDVRRRQLVCACDALGQRQLFYHHNSQRLLCGSTLRQLFCSQYTPRSISQQAVADHLAAVPSGPDKTFFEGIGRLPAGHWMEAKSDGTMRVFRYWDPTEIVLEEKRPAGWYAAGFRERFLDSVQARLRSTSNCVGLHVSGGFDSAAVTGAVHYWNKQSSLGLETWALQNLAPHPAADERQFMQKVMDRYPMPVETTQAEQHWAFRPHEDVAQYWDEPYEADYASRLIAELRIARRRGAKVILGGNGGDELGGSSWYLLDRLCRLRVWRLWSELRSRANGKGQSSLALVQILAGALASRLRRSLVSRTPRLPPWVCRDFAQKVQFAERGAQSAVYRDPARDDTFQRLRIHWSYPQSSVVHAAFGSYGVEMRQPFLDRRLFEWALTVPPFRYGENGRVKAPLRRALADLLPPAIVNRADKGNYIYYWDLGIRERERARILELLNEPVSAELGFVEPRQLRSAYDKYCEGGEIDRRQFWNWLTLESWLRKKGSEGSGVFS